MVLCTTESVEACKTMARAAVRLGMFECFKVCEYLRFPREWLYARHRRDQLLIAACYTTRITVYRN